MAAANTKPWKQRQQALVLVAALLLGLSPLPGTAAPLDACSVGLKKLPRSVFTNDGCFGVVLDSFGIIDGTSEEDVGKCCHTLLDVIVESGGGCACSLRKEFAQRKIDVDRVCMLPMTKERCQAMEDAEKAKADAAQRREDELSKLGACDRLFERLAAGELSKISRDNDIMACRQEMKTCPATCQVQH